MEPIFLAVKSALKSQGWTYVELASELGMSESGIKKMLSAKDVSIGRLARIAGILGIPLSELMRLAEESEIEEVALSGEQESALARDPLLLRVFWRLAVEEEGEGEIRRREKLGLADWNRALHRLERLGLIRSSATRGPRAVHPRLVKWKSGGVLVTKLNREWSRRVLDRALQKGGVHRLSTLKLSDESYSKLCERLHELLDEMARLSERERIGKKAGETRFRSVLFASHPEGLLD